MHHTDVKETKIQFELILLERIGIINQMNVRKGNLITAGTNARVTICTDRPGSAATSRPGPAPPHHRSTAVASHHTPTQTFWSLILYNVTHKNNTYKGMSHNGDKYYNLTMIEPNIGSCNLVILPQG